MSELFLSHRVAHSYWLSIASRQTGPGKPRNFLLPARAMTFLVRLGLRYTTDYKAEYREISRTKFRFGNRERRRTLLSHGMFRVPKIIADFIFSRADNKY